MSIRGSSSMWVTGGSAEQRLVAYASATGVWLSWLERHHDTVEVRGSIPRTPTAKPLVAGHFGPICQGLFRVRRVQPPAMMSETDVLVRFMLDGVGPVGG